VTDFAAAFSAIRAGTTNLCKLQKAYDEEAWEIQNPAWAKLRHVSIHLNIVSGRLATICERADHQQHAKQPSVLADETDLASKIIADLTYHASQIAEVFQLDMADCIINRYRDNSARFCPGSEIAKSFPLDTRA
jgi:hypothetical protein